MKKLLILSGKGGTGKTTVAAAFLSFSRAMAAADCDVDAPNLHLVARNPSQPKVTDFIGGDKAHIDENKCVGCGECIEHCRFGALSLTDCKAHINEYACEGCGVCAHVCPAGAVTLLPDAAGRQELYLGERVFSTAMLKMGRGNSGNLVTKVKLDLLKNAPDCPLAIIDGSPGIGCPVIASVGGMDLVLVVTEPSPSGISDLQRLVKTAESFQVKLAVCVNRWDMSPENTEKIRTFCEGKGLPFLGLLPYDRSASQAINQGLSVAELDCPLRSALKELFAKTMALLELPETAYIGGRSKGD